MELAENSVETAPVVGRPFAPGVSGNPGGRPKGLARYVRALVGEDGRRVADLMLAVPEDERERTEVRPNPVCASPAVALTRILFET
jgi:hypothetical protein